MLESQKLQLRRSEIVQRLNAIVGLEQIGEAETIEERALATELDELETRFRAALLVEATETRTDDNIDSSETRELRAMIDGADVSRYFDAATRGHGLDGLEAELQEHFGLSGADLPIELLQTRAVATITTDVGARQTPIVPPVFATGDAAYLSVPMPIVGVGEAVYPLLTSRPTVAGPLTDSAVAAESTGTFTTDTLAPGRIQASFRYLRTDAARFAGLDASLRAALSSGLSEALDAKVIGQIVTDVSRTDASAVDTFATYRSRMIYAQIDGRYANVESELRLLSGAETLGSMASKYRSNNADDSAVDSLRRISGGVRVSAHIAAKASEKQDVIIRKGRRGDAVAPPWQGIRLIVDEISSADKGEIVITAVMMAAFKITRPAGFARVEAQLA